MKRAVLGLLVGALALGWTGLAEAGGRHYGGHGHGGSYKGHGGYKGYHGGGHYRYYGPGYWGGYYYYAPVVAPFVLGVLTGRVLDPYPPGPAPAPPQAYIEQQSGYWYYCRDPEGYYPYVPECRGDWMQVVPNEPGPGR